MSLSSSFSTALHKIGITTDNFIAGALFRAIRADDGEKVAALLEKKPDALYMSEPDAAPDERETPFRYALTNNKVQSVTAMAKKFPHLLTDHDPAIQETELSLRAQRHDGAAAIALLVSLGADMLEGDDNGDNAVHHAARNTSSSLPLQALGVTEDAAAVTNENGETPLMLAAGAGPALSVERLMALTKDINTTDHGGLNATMHALRHSNLDAATLLLKAGGRVNFNDPVVETQMRVATFEANFDFLTALEARRIQQERDVFMSKNEIAALEKSEAAAKAAAFAQQVEDVVATVKGGVDETQAPAKAAFRKKIPAPAD